MVKYIRALVVMVGLMTTLVIVAPSQADADYYLYSRQGSIDATLGAGIMARSPVRFDLHLAGEYFWRNNISIGASFDSWLRAPNTFVLRGFGRYHFDIHRFPKFVPYVGGGIGAGIDTNGNGIMDILITNFGFKYALTRRIHVGSDMGLHLLTNFSRNRMDFHILFATISYRF